MNQRKFLDQFKNFGLNESFIAKITFTAKKFHFGSFRSKNISFWTKRKFLNQNFCFGPFQKNLSFFEPTNVFGKKSNARPKHLFWSKNFRFWKEKERKEKKRNGPIGNFGTERNEKERKRLNTQVKTTMKSLS